MRQLENAVFRAVVLAETDEVGVEEFPQIAAQLAEQAPAIGGESLPLAATDADTALIVAAEPHRGS